MTSDSHAAMHPSISHDTVLALSGVEIDTSSNKWVIAPRIVIDLEPLTALPEPIFDSLRSYISMMVRTGAPKYVETQLEFLKTAIISQNALSEINKNLKQNGFLEIKLFSLIRLSLSATYKDDTIGQIQSAFRRWYIWSSDNEFEGFHPDIATKLEAIVISRAALGEAVRRQDPQSGPLTRREMADLLTALKLATDDNYLRAPVLLAAWLMVAYGTNPRNLVLLEEQDYIKTPLSDGQIIHELRIPRIKKRTSGPRDQFRVRTLDEQIAKVVTTVIQYNQRARVEQDDSSFSRPLFRAALPHKPTRGSSFEQDAHQQESAWFTLALKRIASAYELKADNGEPLNLTPRRLRYTFATRLVDEGIALLDLAEALDHTTTDYVMVYFNSRSDVVRKLDDALSVPLIPIAQRMLGIVRNETDAIRGDDKASRIYQVDAISKTIFGVGTCGSFATCKLYAPLACYTCRLFQPWLDGPHDRVLASLTTRHASELRKNADEKWVGLHDETMRAVQAVINRCTEIKSSDAA